MLKDRLIIFFFFLIPHSTFSNVVTPTFIYDKVGRVYNNKDVDYKVIAQDCSLEHAQILGVDPSKGAFRKGMKRVEYVIRSQATDASNYFTIPEERVVSLKYGFDSFNKGEIRLPLNKEIPQFTNSIVMYLKGQDSFDKISFVVSEDNITRLYSFETFKKEKFGLFVFPLTRNKKIEKRVLKGIIITHHEKSRLITDVVLSLGEIHFVSFITSRIKKLENREPFFTSIPMGSFTKGYLNNNGPDNLTYAAKEPIFWTNTQFLMLNLETTHPLLLEIYGVLQAREKKAFLIRLRLPYTFPRSCLRVQLPNNLLQYSTKNHQSPTMLLHGIKLIPLKEGRFQDKPSTSKIKNIFFKRSTDY